MSLTREPQEVCEGVPVDPNKRVVNAEMTVLLNEIYEAAGVGAPTFLTWAAAGAVTVAVTTQYIMVDGRLYRRNPGGNAEFTTAGGVPWAPAFSSENDLPIIVMVLGQSNALGGSGTTSGTRATINGRVYCLEDSNTGGKTQGLKRAGPASTDWIGLNAGNSFGYHFCDQLQKSTGKSVVMVMIAAGGQPIEQFLPAVMGIPNATGTQWNRIVAQMNILRALPVPERPDGNTFTALGCDVADIVLMHQGEANADYRIGEVGWPAGTPTEFKTRHRRLLELLRDPASGGLSAVRMLRDTARVIYGGLHIGGTSGANSTDDRNVELLELASYPYCGFAHSDGLRADDDLHFTGRDLVSFADRYFQAYMSVGVPDILDSGLNSGTTWTKYSDGRLVMERSDVASVPTATASGSGFTTGGQVWTFPTGAGIPTFIAAPQVIPQNSGATSRWITTSARSATSVTFVGHSWVSIPGNISIGGRAEGFWR